MDPQSRLTVKLKHIKTPLEEHVWVNYQGDRYVILGSIEYLLTPFVEQMDKFGRLNGRLKQTDQQKAHMEPSTAVPNMVPQRPILSGTSIPDELRMPEEMGFMPSAPPMTNMP